MVGGKRGEGGGGLNLCPRSYLTVIRNEGLQQSTLYTFTVCKTHQTVNHVMCIGARNAHNLEEPLYYYYCYY